MEFKVVENASAYAGRLVAVKKMADISVPEYLTSRVTVMKVTPEKYVDGNTCLKEVNGSRVFNSNVLNGEVLESFVPNGNDAIIIGGNEVMVFSPLVEIASSMGEGFLVMSATGKHVSNAPVCDFDWQDQHFDYTYAQMRAFATMANY